MKLEFIILGCGSSLGVPRIDGNFGDCNPQNIKNIRSRCSGLIKSNNFNILIDTSPDIKHQFLSNKIKFLNCIFYTHQHADQTHGINDLRYFFLKNRKPLPVYANKATSKYLLNSFKYCFKKTSSFYPPIMKLKSLKKNHSFYRNQIQIKSFDVLHGSINSLCYIINNKLAYASDVSHINEKDYSKIYKIKYFIIDCLREEPHPSHYNLDKILELTKELKPYKTILTNLHSSLDYEKIKKKLPKSIIPAYDGMKLLIN
tara:strand:- start:2206 stop:2979 length:774 start_codon:yes stop_codon:yes gene_type:complete